jgi:ABC-type multidrug transport system fused ATPase/permease subunit
MTFGIAIWVGNGNLDLATAFTSLTIMQLVLGPLAWLVSSLPFVFTAMASAERLQEFVEISEENQSLNAGVSNFSATDELPGMPIFPGNPILAAKGATVKVKSKDEPILSDVTFTIQPGSFTVIAGKVGSGKSALIRALLGQLPSSGAILRQVSNIAYCAQSTWLSNATAKNNIIGQSEWDESWYNTVVRACALDQDFRELPDGDSALVGSKGLSLSGGQKQRIVSVPVILRHGSLIYL